MGFGAPVQWRLTTIVGLLLVWLYLFNATSAVIATVVAALLAIVIGVIWYVVRRR